MRARRKLLHMSPYEAAGVTTHRPEPMLLSQSNAHNADGSFWCGRTSASIVWNYYKYVGGMTGELIKNQWETPPYQLMYANGQPAALIDGSCKPAEVFERLSAIHGKTWVSTPIYTEEMRRGAKKPEEWLAPLLDHLDNNNPAFFASGISKTQKYCSHFVVITGYEYADDGSLWLQIHDPARNFSILQMLHGLDPKTATRDQYESFLKIDQPGQWATTDPTQRPWGSIYRVKLDALLTPNPFIGGDVFAAHCSSVPAPNPNLACDNSYRPYFSVMLTDSPLVTGESAFVLTELNLSWPIEPPAEPRAPDEPQTIPEWEPWADSRAPFPLGASMTWHGGAHVQRASASGDRLYSIGPGALVLARFPKEKLDAGGTWTRDEPFPSSGFVLVRHRFDREMRELLEHERDEHVTPAEPTKKPTDPIELFGLAMHTAPISSYLEVDPEQSPVQVGRQNAPAWLRPRLPRRLPEKHQWIPKGTPISLAVFASSEDAAKGAFSPLLPEFSTLPNDHEYTHAPKKTIGGAPTAVVDVAGEPRLPLPNTSYSSGHLAFSGLQPLALQAASSLGYFNPLTRAVVQATPLSVQRGTAVVVASNGEEVEVLARDGGQAWVRTRAYEHPGISVAECKELHRESGVIVVTGDDAELGIEHRGAYLPLRTITPADARLVFSCSSYDGTRARPALWPLVRVPKASYAAWSKQLASAKGELPRATLADLVFYNPITEEVIDGQGGSDPARPVDLKILHGKGRAPSLVLERGGEVFLDVAEVTTCLDAKAEYTPGDVVFFGPGQKEVKLYATTSGEGDKRYFPDADAISLKNVLADKNVLAFRVKERATTKGRDRIWPELVSCAKVPQATVEAWNAELRSSGGTREATRKRLAAGHTALFGAVLDGKSGWVLDEEGRVVLQPEAGVAAELCVVAMEGGMPKLSSLREGTAHSPFEIGSAASPILPVALVHDKAGAVVAAVFEVAKTVPDGRHQSNDAERSKVATENESKWKDVTGTLAAGALIDMQGEPVRVAREQIALADPMSDFAHVELFSEKNVVADVDGSDEVLVHASKTPFWVFRDDDAVDTYSADFVKKMREALAEKKAAFRIDDRALATADREGGVIKPSEWLAYCEANQRMFSFIISVTRSEWHSDYAKVLDEAKRRGAHLAEAELERTKKELARLAFLDSLHSDARMYFHYHPLRFVEWLLTGVDVEVKGAKTPEVVIGPRGGPGIDAKTSRPTFFRHRTTVGDTQPHINGVVTLGGDIGTKNNKIPVTIERGRIQRLAVVKPYVVCRISPNEKLDVDLAYHVSYSGSAGATLLADGGVSPHGTTLGTLTYEIEAGWNLIGPSKLKASLAGDVNDFEILAVRAPTGATVSKQKTSFEVTWQRKAETEAFRASKSEVVQVDVIARGGADKAAHLEITAEGGDLGSIATKSSDVKTRTIASTCDSKWNALTIGEDVAELQLYLSQILAWDDKPCLGHRDEDAAKNLGLNGRYDRKTASGVWRFLYSYANDPRQALAIDSVPVTDIHGKPGKKEPATLASMRTPALAVRDARCGKNCDDYPMVDGKLAAEIAKRFRPPHVLPLVELEVTTGTSTHGFATGPVAMDLGATCGSMLLPDDDVIELFASAQGMRSLKGTLDVVVEVPGASAYALSGAAKHTLTPSASTFAIKLVPSGKLSVKAADNTLVVKASNGAVLASIVLGGARDLLASKARDGVDKRDAFILQTWLHNVESPHQGPLLVAGPYYAPKAGVLLDGKWGEIQNAAFKRFAADRGASSWTEAVKKLRDAANQHASAAPWFPPMS